MCLRRGWAHFLPLSHSAKAVKSSTHLTVWWIIHGHAPKVGGPGRSCNILGEGSNSRSFHQTQVVGGLRRTCESIESFLNCPRFLTYGVNYIALIYVMPNIFTSSWEWTPNHTIRQVFVYSLVYPHIVKKRDKLIASKEHTEPMTWAYII